MTTEFGWWAQSPDGGKFQVKALVHGGKIEWRRQLDRFRPWEPHFPGAEDWDRLLADAARRLPRRLLSPRQFEELKRMRPA